GSKTEAEVVVVEIADGAQVGRGECVPYPRYGETIAGAIATIESIRTVIEGGMDRAALQSALPPGAARNAVDCALWDLAAKPAGPAARRPACAARARHRLHPEPRHGREHGGGRAGQCRTAAAQAEAVRPRRPRPRARRACERPQGAPHRRCQRSLDTCDLRRV